MRLVLFLLLIPACTVADTKRSVEKCPSNFSRLDGRCVPDRVSGEDAAEVMAAKVAVEVARLKYLGTLERFETRYDVKIDQGDGWDEVNGELKVRRLPKEKK